MSNDGNKSSLWKGPPSIFNQDFNDTMSINQNLEVGDGNDSQFEIFSSLTNFNNDDFNRFPSVHFDQLRSDSLSVNMNYFNSNASINTNTNTIANTIANTNTNGGTQANCSYNYPSINMNNSFDYNDINSIHQTATTIAPPIPIPIAIPIGTETSTKDGSATGSNVNTNYNINSNKRHCDNHPFIQHTTTTTTTNDNHNINNSNNGNNGNNGSHNSGIPFGMPFSHESFNLSQGGDQIYATPESIPLGTPRITPTPKAHSGSRLNSMDNCNLTKAQIAKRSLTEPQLKKRNSKHLNTNQRMFRITTPNISSSFNYDTIGNNTNTNTNNNRNNNSNNNSKLINFEKSCSSNKNSITSIQSMPAAGGSSGTVSHGHSLTHTSENQSQVNNNSKQGHLGRLRSDSFCTHGSNSTNTTVLSPQAKNDNHSFGRGFDRFEHECKDNNRSNSKDQDSDLSDSSSDEPILKRSNKNKPNHLSSLPLPFTV